MFWNFCDVPTRLSFLLPSASRSLSPCAARLVGKNVLKMKRLRTVLGTVRGELGDLVPGHEQD